MKNNGSSTKKKKPCSVRPNKNPTCECCFRCEECAEMKRNTETAVEKKTWCVDCWGLYTMMFDMEGEL